MTVKVVSLNVHGHRIDLAAYGEKFIGDNDYLAFGDGEDITAKWDGSKLIILPVTDDAGSIEIGDGTTNVDFLLHAPNNAKFHWDQSANVLYIIATTMMGYGSQFQFTPGGVGAGTGISFHNTAQYIRSIAGNVLEINGQAFLNVASKLVCANTIALTYAVTPSLLGELAIASDNRLEYCVSTAPIVYRVPFYNHTGTSDVTLPTGIGLNLGDKLGLQVSAAVATVLGDVYLDSADKYITYSVGGGLEYKCAILDNTGHLRLPELTTTATVRGQIYLDSDNRLTYSPGSSLEYKLPSYNATGGTPFTTPAGIGITCGSYLKLWVATGPNPTVQGEMYFRTLDKKIVIYDGTALKVVTFD